MLETGTQRKEEKKEKDARAQKEREAAGNESEGGKGHAGPKRGFVKSEDLKTGWKLKVSNDADLVKPAICILLYTFSMISRTLFLYVARSYCPAYCLCSIRTYFPTHFLRISSTGICEARG